MTDRVFEERTGFNQWWLWLILLGILAIPIVGIYEQVIMGRPFGDSPMSDAGLIVFLVFALLFVFLFYYMRLIARVDEYGVFMRFRPFVTKELSWEEIASHEILEYGFVGGWGIRLTTRYGTVYNTGGRIGLAITTRKGDRFIIGTRDSSKLKQVLENLGK